MSRYSITTLEAQAPKSLLGQFSRPVIQRDMYLAETPTAGLRLENHKLAEYKPWQTGFSN